MSQKTENPTFVTVTESLYKCKGFKPALMRWNSVSEQYEIHSEGAIQLNRKDAVAAAENWAKKKGCELRV